MNGRRPVYDTPATPHFDFLYGRYNLSPWVIPYFSTTMSVKDAAESLRLAADFPGSDDVKWKLDELYQREVDWSRVERKIVPYLHASEQPQFFNALTIALLPTERNVSGLTQSFSADNDWRPPDLSDPKRFGKELSVGPIRCGFWNPWEDFSQVEARTGQIRWNPEQVFAVALDGQHRLAAIQQFVRSQGVPAGRLNETAVPVIFVVLDSAFGYVSPTNRPVVDVLRAIFIDLNKHAKIPSRARQILLDDKDPASVCVRALVGEALSDDTRDLQARPPRIPLSLVDWHTEQAKFDDGPYVTTILTLDWAITELTGSKPVQDLMDYNAFRRQLKALTQSLTVDLSAAWDRLTALAQTEYRPFNFSEEENNNEIEKIAAAFQQIWNPVFVHLLTEFTPYRDLISIRRSKDTFTLDFSNWYRYRYQHKKDRYAGRATEEYKQFMGRLQGKPMPVGESRLDAILSDIKGHKDDNLAFNVVFQRAYFLAFGRVRSIKDEHFDELIEVDFDEGLRDEDTGTPEYPHAVGNENRSAGTDERLISAQRFVNAMNTLVAAIPEILRSECVFETADGDEQRFWLGTFLTADRGIDFTQGASVRGHEVIFWAVAMQMYDAVVDPDTRSSFEDFWGAVLEAKGGLTKRIWQSVKRFADKESSAGGRILKADGEKFDLEKSREEAQHRMLWLWKNLGL